jgi:periplasmic protein TonB
MELTNPMFETLSLRQLSGGQKRRRKLTLPLSVAAHAVALSAVVLLPLLSAELPPDPTGSAVHAFFVVPVAPPPAPPPPAKAPSAHVAPKPVSPPTKAFVSPVETPDQVAPEAANDREIDLGSEQGVEGGVEGGVPGGVVGGVVGGLPEVVPAPVQPVRVGGGVKEPRKLKNVDPVYPPFAQQARLQGLVTLECLLSPDGRVADVKVLAGLPLLTEAAVQAVKQWVFTPTLFNGVPVPAIMTVTVRFAL